MSASQCPLSPPTPTSEEWEAAMRYGDAHASEIEQNDPVAEMTNTSNLAQYIFDTAHAVNRAAAEFYRRTRI